MIRAVEHRQRGVDHALAAGAAAEMAGQRSADFGLGDRASDRSAL
jgi:hypothetical protein